QPLVARTQPRAAARFDVAALAPADLVGVDEDRRLFVLRRYRGRERRIELEAETGACALRVRCNDQQREDADRLQGSVAHRSRWERLIGRSVMTRAPNGPDAEQRLVAHGVGLANDRIAAPGRQRNRWIARSIVWRS